MASKDKDYSSEFKTEIAKKALHLSDQEIKDLSNECDVPVSKIKVWKTELAKAVDNLDNVFGSLTEQEIAKLSDKPEEVEIEITNTGVANSLEKGVMSDKLNYKRIAFWCVLGIILFVVIIQALVEANKKNVADYEVQSQQEEQYLADQLRRQANKNLSSFGVINLEEKTYRIPIDSAMDDVIKEQQNK